MKKTVKGRRPGRCLALFLALTLASPRLLMPMAAYAAEPEEVREIPGLPKDFGDEPVEEPLNEPEAALPETAEEEAKGNPEEEMDASGVYSNYVYGDPDYNGNYIRGVAEDGNVIPELYTQDLEEIISMARAGMELSRFFDGTIFKGFCVEDLIRMQEEGYIFDQIAHDFTEGEELPDWLSEALSRGMDRVYRSRNASAPDSLTSTGVNTLAGSALGVISSLGSAKSHGPIKKLTARGSDGVNYAAFCAKYGGSYSSGWQYAKADYADCEAPNGKNLTVYQYDLINVVINTYLKTTQRMDQDYASAQLIIWYIINNLSDGEYYDPAKAWTEGGIADAAAKIYPQNTAFIYHTIFAYSYYINMWVDGTLDLDHFPNSDRMPGSHAKIQFWGSAENHSQWIITWSEGMAAGSVNSLSIPYIDNIYMEKRAAARYAVEVTKESIITNELLSGIVFDVVESGASGHDLSYDIYTGTEAAYGTDYPNATVSGGSFGQTRVSEESVPYMDDDVTPSGGRHRTTITTDGRGHASAVFVHTHTFREFYSVCYADPGEEISFEEYKTQWEGILKKAAGLGTDEKLAVSYLGEIQEMGQEEIEDIYKKQQIVYTQTQQQAVSVLNQNYQAYMDRTYTYTVTELDNYNRLPSEDSNGKLLDEVQLPREGYRKNVEDATTMGAYQETVASGGTMTAGGRNDSDEHTKEPNVTNEPWYNQIFIHKTDLETNNQILYDTRFEIYEYFAYRTETHAAEQRLYPAMLLNQMVRRYGAELKPEHIAAAKLLVRSISGKEYLEQQLDVEELRKNLDSPYELSVGFTPKSAGEYQALLEITIDNSLGEEEAWEKTYDEVELVEKENHVYGLKLPVPHCIELVSAEIAPDAGSGQEVEYTTVDGESVHAQLDMATGITSFVYTAEDGTVQTFNSKDHSAGTIIDGENLYFRYFIMEDSGITLIWDGKEYTGFGGGNQYIKAVRQEDGSMTLSYFPEKLLENGTYTCKSEFSVSAGQMMAGEKNKNVGTDPEDYKTWGQDNYEIVRVTADIAKRMGWSDTAIGMYTVHRLSPTDQYTGTTFSSAIDEATGEAFGYCEYGTLYYTQANQGKFCIVEEAAPADGGRNGYLGNYEDRDYTKLSEESKKKNQDGLPYDTENVLSSSKMAHYLHLCEDTNQYASYMLTDGYKGYDSLYYLNYIETLDNLSRTPTEDGYDAQYYDQSGLKASIGLERFTLTDAKHDVLNSYWDQYMNQYLREKSGILVSRDSEKTDTYYALREALDCTLNFVGTTIAGNSYDDGLSGASKLAVHGSCTDTQINYHSYAGEQADFLNRRSGFQDTEYLQVGEVIYDGADREKEARFRGTEKEISREPGYAFIDERTYGFIRFTKYDAEAERYVSGTLDEQYEAGTDHGDADLDGAVYSLYVSENNVFEVEYYEGTLEGRTFWAQPLKTGGFRVIYDADGNADNGFTDKGTNAYEDYPHAYLSRDIQNGGRSSLGSHALRLCLDYGDDRAGSAKVVLHTERYNGIRHPDGMYGGAKHNGWFAVLTERQVFVDADGDGYGDTWTLQDVTLEAGAKAASAAIRDGELQIDGLYLGSYYLAEEVRDSIVVFSMDNNDGESSEIKWLSFAPGYLAATDEHGNPVKYFYKFPYQGEQVEDDSYEVEQAYVQKETGGVSRQQAVKGAGFQINKQVTDEESAASGNTQYKALEGAGFTVYLLSELNLIKDGTIAPAFSIDEGNRLVHRNELAALFDETDNFVGYQFTGDYLSSHHLFEEKYGNADYDIDRANRLIYVPGRAYYYLEDILAAYRDRFYSNEIQKWDFTGESRAIARMYEDDAAAVEKINQAYSYQKNHLNSGSPCEWYGVNGISDGWTATGVKNEYQLAELFTNHYGHIRSPELPWGAYLVVETTTPQDVFTVEPFFVTISDSSPTQNRTKYVTETDSAIVSSLVMVKRDAQSGQNVIQSGVSYRIWDYQKNNYLKQYLYGPDGNLSMIQKFVFMTEEDGCIDAVASLEKGYYRLEELAGPKGFYNPYWDYGNPSKGERLGGIGDDAERLTKDNMFVPCYGTVDFEVTTDRRYKASGIVSNGNLDYIYIGESYYNREAVGKLNILKTGEVLADYVNTDEIAYADEPEDATARSSARERETFERIKRRYDLGTDAIAYRMAETGTQDEHTEEAVYDPDISEDGDFFDFVYEERPLANAVYRITAAEDIHTQDGNGGTWFKKGDVVATVETAENGEIVSFAPEYKTAEDGGSGVYEYTYYYGDTNGTKTSLTGEKSYVAEEFATTGSVENHWLESRMSQKDKDIYGTPAFTDGRIYPNTFYREQSLRIMRRIYRSSGGRKTEATDYVTRLENEGNLSSDSAGILTETADGYRLTYTYTNKYTGAVLREDGSGCELVLRDGNSVRVREAPNLFRVTASIASPWDSGDLVERTAGGYRITHTDAAEAGVSKGAATDGARDLGYTYVETYDNASIRENDDGTWTLLDRDGAEVVAMEGGVVVTAAGGFVEKTAGGYQVTDVRHENISDNEYLNADLTVRGAELTVKSERWHLMWDALTQRFMTTSGSIVALSDDYSTLTVTTGETSTDYHAFDLFVEYDLKFASRENIVQVEKDGTLGEVSVYLPLGKYHVQEIAAPYGFLLNERIQTVEFDYADQIKEVVFNTNEESASGTEGAMEIWTEKGLPWFPERACFWTWGTYGDAEKPYYEARQGILPFYNLRVKAWSQKDVPDTPENPEPPDAPEDDRRPESPENQWKLGVGVYKEDKGTQAPLGGAKFGLYTKDNIYNVDGRLLIKAGGMLAVATTDETGFANFAVDIPLMSRYLDGEASDADLIYQKTVSDGLVEESIDGNTAGNTGDYYIRELTPPDGYLIDDKAYPVTFRYDDEFTMYIPVYAMHANVQTGVGITKYDLTGARELPGARISLYKIKDINRMDTDGLLSHEEDNLLLIEEWTSTDKEHVSRGLFLSNREWPRLDNQEMRDNVYVLREELPPPGYATASDIEFKLYQICDEEGCWADAEGELYGYQVFVNQISEKLTQTWEPLEDLHIGMYDDDTKLEVSKVDAITGEEISGAKLEIWTADKKGSPVLKMESWVTGQDGYDESGVPKKHCMDGLPIGSYVLIEREAPQGYLLAENVPFEITDTSSLQELQMVDSRTRLKIHKYRANTDMDVEGATIDVYEIPEKYFPYLEQGSAVSVRAAEKPELTLELSEAELQLSVVTESTGSAILTLEPGWYVAVESKAPKGYVLDSEPQVFQLKEGSGEQTICFYNHMLVEKDPKPEPEPPVEAAPAWNNVRTEDSGEIGYSVKVKLVDENPWQQVPWVPVCLAFIMLGVSLGYAWIFKRRI